MIAKIVFCPNCRKKIIIPEVVRTGNMVITTGFVTVECGDKKCGGKVKIKIKKQEV